MNKNDKSLFTSVLGREVYECARRAIDEYGMTEKLRSGVLVGLSGGADSVLLLRFLLEYRTRSFDFPIVAVHVNHNIRGEEADRDERFAKGLAAELGVEFICISVDVPAIARDISLGLEETARNVRYSEFEKIISSRNDISTIAVAHNATDNLETVIFNIMRGAGTRGAAGIPPIRDNVIRPLINVSKPDICNLLSEGGIEYVTDSTNLSTDYTRNFLRHNVIESLREVFVSPEASASRLSRNLRRDDEYLCILAEQFVLEHNTIYTDDLAALHDSVFARVIKILAERKGSSVEETHVNAIRQHLRSGDFSISLPSRMRFTCERGVCNIVSEEREANDDSIYPVAFGKTEIEGYNADFFLSDAKNEEISRNVYKISIQANLASAIIDGVLHVRFKRDGDTIFYGGHTHKLKKVFTDLKIPVSLRSRIPLLCDDKGVVWVPGLAVRDDSPTAEHRRDLYVAFCIRADGEPQEKRAHLLTEFRINTKV